MHSKFNFAGQSNRILAGARFAQPAFFFNRRFPRCWIFRPFKKWEVEA
jgi:hypothetical protein